MEKANKSKQVPTQEDIKPVLPNRKMPMMSQNIIGKARAKTGMGRGINNMLNPSTRQSPYNSSE
jgi:hypothetical protein